MNDKTNKNMNSNKKRNDPDTNHTLEEAESTKQFAKEVVVDDLLGKDDWKRSKIAYLSGFSVIGRSVGTIGNTASDSVNRIKSLTQRVIGNQNLPSLPDGGTAEDRYWQALHLHGKTEDDVLFMKDNTYKSTLLYGILSIVALLLGMFSFVYIPYRGVIDCLTRFAPFFIVAPLTLKHALTNYILHEKKLVGLWHFLISGDYFPKK